MYRIVGSDLFKGHTQQKPGRFEGDQFIPNPHHSDMGYDVTIKRLGNGHTEVRMKSIVVWEHVGVLSDEALAARHECVIAEAEERRKANAERAAIRAKQRVRDLCKASGVDTMLTLTYAVNMTDWEQLKAHVKEFNRRMSRLILGWFYVAAFERQKRGAWHVHMAVHRLPALLNSSNAVKVKSFHVIRAVWRAVVGEFGGNIDVQSRKRNSQRAPSRIASYLSKYMTKAFEEGEAWKNRFSSSKGVTIPKPERIRFAGYSFGDVAQLVFDELDKITGYCSHMLVHWRLSKWKDGLVWIVDERARPRISGDVEYAL